MTKIGRLYRESMIDQIKTSVTGSDNVFLLSYSQLSGLQMSDLRKSLSQTGANVYVAKNSIARLAFKDLEQDSLSNMVSGQTALIWGGADSVEVSKVLMDFIKFTENAAVQGGLLQGRVLEREDIEMLSELPSREVLLSMLLGVIQSPLTRLASALNAKTRDLLSILKQLSEKKGGNDNV